MNNSFDHILMNAIFKCSGWRRTEDDEARKGFANLYHFTTENIYGYINKFDLNNKSLLTVGSSGDQVINASLFNCKNITVVDICPYTKFYFYLKKASILTLEYEEFLEFFCYSNYSKVNDGNKGIFNKEKFIKIRNILRLLDYEPYLFWDDLFQEFNSVQIRTGVFSEDYDYVNVLKKVNPYMYNEEYFKKTKEMIKNINPKFITDDICKIKLFEEFDNIWLSNIGTYYSIEELKEIVESLSLYLKENGQMLMCYLYETKEDTPYQEEWPDVYNLKKTIPLFKEYITEFYTFEGINGISNNDDDIKDSVLIYKKIK